MINLVLQLIGVGVIGNMIAHWFGPIQAIKDWLSIRELRFGWVVSCSKCMSFWTGVFVFQDIYLAAISGLLGWSINWYLDIIDNWYTKD